MLALCCLASPAARADIEVEVRGVDDQLAKNVLAYLSLQRYKDSTDLDAETIERLHVRVEREVQAALKPYGYYEPDVHSDVASLGHGNWHVTVSIGERDIRRVRIGQSAALSGAAFDDEVYTATVFDIGTLAIASSLAYAVL